MGVKKAIVEQQELVSTFRLVAQVFQEVSLLRIGHIREQVLASRDYLTALSEVYLDVKSSYAHKMMLSASKQKSSKKNKTLAILISANAKLFGSIIHEVFEKFASTVTPDMDVLIVGKLGYGMFKERFPGRTCLYFEISDRDYQIQDLRPMLFHILNYEKVIVYHGIYGSILHQSATISNITGQALFESTTGTERQNENRFYFEPTLEDIVAFFETQIFTNLYKQTLDESQLARNASRVKAMEQTMDNLADEEKKLKVAELKAKKKLISKKQVGLYAGSLMW